VQDLLSWGELIPPFRRLIQCDTHRFDSIHTLRHFQLRQFHSDPTSYRQTPIFIHSIQILVIDPRSLTDYHSYIEVRPLPHPYLKFPIPVLFQLNDDTNQYTRDILLVENFLSGSFKTNSFGQSTAARI
jgi:hypothetical protein